MWEIGAGGEGAKVSWGSGGMSKGGMGAMCRVSFSKTEHEGGVSTPQVEGGMGPVCFHESPAIASPAIQRRAFEYLF